MRQIRDSKMIMKGVSRCVCGLHYYAGTKIRGMIDILRD
jgi:hypothetical protein